MRCSKCGYISFDFNQMCPKCSKSISDEQEKLNLPSFRPSPPSLLGVLLGEADDSDTGVQGDSNTAIDSAEIDIELDDSGVIEPPAGKGMDAGQDFDVSFEDENLQEIESSVNEMEKYEDVIPDLDLDEEDEGLSLELNNLSFDDADDETDIDLDLEDITLSEPEVEVSESDKSAAISTPVETEKEIPVENQSEIEIELDDLKVNETGQLEISSLNMQQARTQNSSDSGEVSIEGPDEEEEISLDLGDLALDEIIDKEAGMTESPAGAEFFSDDINLETENIETEGTTDSVGLNQNEETSGDEDFSEPGEMAFDLDDSKSDVISEQEELLKSDKKKDDIEFDDFDFDLENLDLDLDLGDSDDK